MTVSVGITGQLLPNRQPATGLVACHAFGCIYTDGHCDYCGQPNPDPARARHERLLAAMKPRTRP